LSNIVNIAKNLRKRPTEAEKLLWKHLRGKSLEGLKFRRQHPIGKHVVDFVCLDKRLVIELDGGQHAGNKNKDIERDKWLQVEGYKVLRFWNNEVLENMEGVLEVIKKEALSHPPPSSSPQGRGRIKAPPPASKKKESNEND
jgi:very-short-patch-repair endonuclease